MFCRGWSQRPDRLPVRCTNDISSLFPTCRSLAPIRHATRKVIVSAKSSRELVESVLNLCGSRILKRAPVSHSYRQRQLYDVVTDIDAYHLFVPFCTSSRTLARRQRQGTTAIEMEAELTVGFFAFSEAYVSKVTCRPYESVKVRVR